VNDALASLDDDFDRLYVDFGRPSIAPERLIRASLLQILFSIRSERQLMEYPSWSSRFRGPIAVGFDESVGRFDELSHERDDGHLGGLSGRAQGVILRLEIRVEAHGHEGRHVERVTQGLSPAADE
jgi:hypothetical protein